MSAEWGLAGTALAQLGGGASFFGLLSSIGLFGKFILLVLVLFMASAIGLLFERILFLGRAAEESRRFLVVFRRSQRFSEVRSSCNELKRSPLVGLFLAGSSELNYQLRANPTQDGSRSPAPDAEKPTVRSIEAISRALHRASSVEVSKLERGVPFLATTATVTPFIGLLGTVVGIMNAFMEIGLQHSVGLATVAPGIAEALINTAAGLAAAIPAVMGYNFLVTRIKRLAADMDDFSLEFVSITERNFSD